MEAVEEENDRRKHRRLLVKMGILCRKVGTVHDQAFSGSSVNISPDGLLVEASPELLEVIGQDAVADAGDLYNLELDIPAVDRADQIGGKVSAYAKVVRIIEPPPDRKAVRKLIAFKFCSRPQFDI
jgi:hypothetical protein